MDRSYQDFHWQKVSPKTHNKTLYIDTVAQD